jgi:hypothetical protein
MRGRTRPIESPARWLGTVPVAPDVSRARALAHVFQPGTPANRNPSNSGWNP